MAASKINALNLCVSMGVISKTREWKKNASRLHALGYKTIFYIIQRDMAYVVNTQKCAWE